MQPQSFQDFAKLKGIQLLKDDIKFIRKCLPCIPYQKRRLVLEKYADTWLQGMNTCDNVIRKDNVGRFLANSFLREQANG